MEVLFYFKQENLGVECSFLTMEIISKQRSPQMLVFNSHRSAVPWNKQQDSQRWPTGKKAPLLRIFHAHKHHSFITMIYLLQRIITQCAGHECDKYNSLFPISCIAYTHAHLQTCTYLSAGVWAHAHTYTHTQRPTYLSFLRLSTTFPLRKKISVLNCVQYLLRFQLQDDSRIPIQICFFFDPGTVK